MNPNNPRTRERVPSRRVNGRARTGDIDAVLDQVKDGWEFVIEPDFNHVDLALELLEGSSSGKDMESFRRTKDMLSRVLKGSVDKHYQAFAASLPHHASLLGHFTTAQTQMSDARTALYESKESLGARRADLVQLWSRGQTLEEMMKILDQIEHLKLVPDMLETLISEKRLLQAAVLLVRSLKVVKNADMMEIGAVSDLRSYLNTQETALKDILVDELQSHLYLKSFWCESRWSAYIPGQRTFAKTEYDNEITKQEGVHNSIDPPSRPARLHRFLHELGLKPNDPPIDINEANVGNKSHLSAPLASYIQNGSVTSINPEADSFSYIETLLESLTVLGKLSTALDAITQRLPTEVFSLVETTIDEVEERAEFNRRMSAYNINGAFMHSDIYGVAPDLPTNALGDHKFIGASSLRLHALESIWKQTDHEVLRDFFWTLYSKLDAVAQGLRVVYEVVNRITTRRDFKDSSGVKAGSFFPLTELWNPVELEVRTLIRDYLTNEEEGVVSGRNPISSINETLKEGKSSRDRTKMVFRLRDTDAKLVNKVLKPHEDELTRMLKDTMPGLVAGSTESPLSSILLSSTSEDRILGIGHHRQLIKADAFHATILFQPTQVFLDRIAEILPIANDSSKASSTMLDDFVLKVYLPQLEDKVSALFHQAISAPDAFELDPSSHKLSSEPLIKASTQLMALINSLCAMYQTTPFHKESYSRLILGVIIQFYQRCSDHFQVLVSTSSGPDSTLDSKLSLAAQLAQRSELGPCLTELLRTEEGEKLLHLCRQETNIELELVRKTTVTHSDLVSSIKGLASLASLYHSVVWFAHALNELKSSNDPDIISPISPVEEPSTAISLVPPIALTVEVDDELKLPLTKEMALRFQALLKTYEQVAGLILDCIRIDIRCRSIYYLESAMREGSHRLDAEATEPDPYIVDLNGELAQCDSLVSIRLPPRERQYVFVGLGHLLEHMLILGARHLKLPNEYGIKKLLRNMLALQQSVKSLTHERHHTEFERAKQYYSLFFISPQDMINSIRQSHLFNFEEYQTMLNLQCGVDPSAGEAGVARATDRNYNMYLIELHGMEIEDSS